MAKPIIECNFFVLFNIADCNKNRYVTVPNDFAIRIAGVIDERFWVIPSKAYEVYVRSNVQVVFRRSIIR